MTVKELIEKLSKCDEDDTVTVSVITHGYSTLRDFYNIDDVREQQYAASTDVEIICNN